MRALVLWGNQASPNLGVRALGEGVEALLRRADPSCEVRHQGYGPGDAPVRIGSWRTQLKRLVRDQDGITDWVRGFDLVLDTRSGDSFADIYGLFRLLNMNLMGEIVRRARVPVVFVPQTIGPFQTRRGRLLARRALSTARGVMARDRRSAEVAAGLGRPVDLLSTDVVFALDGAARSDMRRDVVVNASGLLWEPNPHVDYQGYRAFMIDLCTRLLRSGRTVALLSHVIDSPDRDNDVPAMGQLADRLRADGLGEVELLIPRSLSEVREQIASAQLLIGARMHACLNALSQGIPAIPLAYSRKFEPLLQAIGWNTALDLRTSMAGLTDTTMDLAVDDNLPAAARAARDRAQELLEPVARYLASFCGAETRA